MVLVLVGDRADLILYNKSVVKGDLTGNRYHSKTMGFYSVAMIYCLCLKVYREWGR